jgi:hypothetical protein
VVKSEEKYWVFDWLDRHRASSIGAVRLLLCNPVAMDDLRQGADTAIREYGKAVAPSESVLAGRGIDLSGQLDCFAPDWRKQQAQRLFSKVWHYFDRIVIEDSIAHEFALHRNDSEIPEWLLSHLEVLLYLRQIGAEPLLAFRLKPPPCQVHLAQHVGEASLSLVLRSENRVAKSLAKKAEVVLQTRRDGSIGYALNLDGLGHTQWGTVPKDAALGLSDDQVKVVVVKRVFENFLAYLASDVRAAQKYNTPLGSAIPFHQTLLRMATPPSVADVAMRVRLPVLEGLSPDVLLRIRSDEHQYFDRFKTQLRLAIQERLQAADSDDPEKVAKEIQRDLIQPELNAIQQRLTAAEKVVVKKSGLGIFMGALATTCGLLASAAPPIALLAGVTAAVAITGNAASKYVDEKSEVGLSGMYFAWRAEKHV